MHVIFVFENCVRNLYVILCQICYYFLIHLKYLQKKYIRFIDFLENDVSRYLTDMIYDGLQHL